MFSCQLSALSACVFLSKSPSTSDRSQSSSSYCVLISIDRILLLETSWPTVSVCRRRGKLRTPLHRQSYPPPLPSPTHHNTTVPKSPILDLCCVVQGGLVWDRLVQDQESKTCRSASATCRAWWIPSPLNLNMKLPAPALHNSRQPPAFQTRIDEGIKIGLGLLFAWNKLHQVQQSVSCYI
jgi:hypothetical protein